MPPGQFSRRSRRQIVKSNKARKFEFMSILRLEDEYPWKINRKGVLARNLN